MLAMLPEPARGGAGADAAPLGPDAAQQSRAGVPVICAWQQKSHLFRARSLSRKPSW